MKLRNTDFVQAYSKNFYDYAIKNGLMQTTIKERDGKNVVLENGKRICEFINCSYLGLDLHPSIVEQYHKVDPMWGVNFCCARSRFTIAPLTRLEEDLSSLFQGHAITFPSVTTTHISVMPLIASGLLLKKKGAVRFVFDQLAHASMQFLKPILAAEGSITIIEHNNMNMLEDQLKKSQKDGEICVYVCDGIYSMGGRCPLDFLLDLNKKYDFYMYIDDAHGTSILGEQGEGSVLCKTKLQENMFISFCLSKGFGCNGGGILLPFKWQEEIIRKYGQIYAFSASLDFSVVQACHASIELHKDKTVSFRQKKLQENVAFFDALMNFSLPFSPIRMIEIGDEDKALQICKMIMENGFFLSVAFFPIVKRQKAQLRVCICATHTRQQIESLAKTIKNCLDLFTLPV
ncbi:MAG: 8-amino-7-oxononanoate synthase/2-amino-3-ketobutyrate coenzyme A ligase [Holosporales bacterium]